MTNSEILKHIDHTLLKPCCTWDDIKKLCDDAVKYGTASVCVPPSYVARIHAAYGEKLNICTVVGFPLGYSTTSAKVQEVKQALADGASEIDMVVNLGDVKNGDFEKITEEISAMKNAVGSNILKVIIETCYLTEDEKIALCKCVTNGKADYIKTSTGFGTGGAVLDDILLMKKHIGENVKIKAAGGVKTKADLEMFLNEGCDRIGTSSAVAMLAGEQANGY
ncbi:MAG: deoxyribose-phosphate aldolase [Oscillospiraceae bacterium]|nr:deoxyribose-phosphate aldolase [Oscillospiraceae bacterium]